MRLVSAYFLGRSHLRALHRFLQLSRDHAAAGLACVQVRHPRKCSDFVFVCRPRLVVVVDATLIRSVRWRWC